MIDMEIPLNQGAIRPIDVRIPEDSLLRPSEDAAVCAGNVLTSQRVVDVIFKAFSAVAASQGCMNNLTFGIDDSEDSFGYYETICGGSGGGPTWDGTSGVHTKYVTSRIQSVPLLPSIRLRSRFPRLSEESGVEWNASINPIEIRETDIPEPFKFPK